MVQSNSTATLGSETASPPAQSVTVPGLPVAWVFDGTDPDGRPLVRRPPLDPAEVQAISHYLRNAPMVMAPGPPEQDQLDPRRGNVVPTTWHTDGDWIWPGSVDYYLQVHGLPPQPELVAHMRRRGFTIPIVPAERRQMALAIVGGAPVPTPRPTADNDAAGASAVAEPAVAAPEAVEEPRVDEPEAAENAAAAPEPPPQAGTDSPELRTALLRAKAAVADLGIDPQRVCIDGERDGAWCLCRDGERWLVYARRGDRRKGSGFDTVHDAVDFFVGHLYLRQDEYRSPVA